jgi:hypothetical protein
MPLNQVCYYLWFTDYCVNSNILQNITDIRTLPIITEYKTCEINLGSGKD